MGENLSTAVARTTPSRERPVGVTIVAVLCFIVAARPAISAFLKLILGSIALRGVIPEILINPLAGIVVVSVWAIEAVRAVLFIALGVGLLKLQNWARVLLIVLSGLPLLLIASSLMFSHIYHVAFAPGPLILIGVLVYLFRPHVKQAFGASKF